jgi:triphosphoribosyl-dephospho-CoA synthase
MFQHSLDNPKRIARFYAKIAVRALFDEVSLYPKPGLVSFVDSGAHKDMDGQLFLRSLFGLRHYFFNIGLRAALGDTPRNWYH